MPKKQQTLYRLEQDGEYKWFKTTDTFSSSDNFEEYTGEVRKGVPHGKGEIKSEKGHPQWTYTGEWENGKEHGDGKIVYGDGSFYEGKWKNGNYEIGKDNIFSGTYEGEYKNGLRHGRGILNYGKEVEYEGEFRKGLFHGEGKFEVYVDFDIDDLYDTYSELNKEFGFFYNPLIQIISFNGTWKKGVPLKGKGKIREYKLIDNDSIHVYENIDMHSLSDDMDESYSTFIGDIENGLPHGFGELSNSDEQYEGYFEKGNYSGNGTLTINQSDTEETIEGVFQNGIPWNAKRYDPNGNLNYEILDGTPDWSECVHDLSQYVGEWKFGLPNGHGKLETEDFHYEGDWLNGVFHGDGDLREFYEKDYEGREYFMEYSGEFKYGKKNGEGEWVSHNSKVVGEFKNDEPWNTKRFDSTGNLIHEIIKGEWDEDDDGDEKDELFGFDNEGLKYEGDLKNGKYEGQGTLIWKNGNRFEGKFRNGIPTDKGTLIWHHGDRFEGLFEFSETVSGKGSIIYDDGDIYDGEWIDWLPEGNGKMLTEDGDEYEGNWSKGHIEGQGIIKFKDGGSYTGELKDSEFCGQGTMKYNNGEMYTGEWWYGERTGFGKFTLQDGSIYEGEWFKDEIYGAGIFNESEGKIFEGYFKKGKYWDGILKDKDGEIVSKLVNGKDENEDSNPEENDETVEDGDRNERSEEVFTVTWDNGDKYEGHLKDGIPHGYGIYLNSEGDRYEGEFLDGERNGLGIYYFNDGGKYIGQWSNGEENGFGKFISSDGVIYEGDWKDGQMHGFGRMTDPDGEKLTGDWENGEQKGLGVIENDGGKYIGDLIEGEPERFGIMIHSNGDKYFGEWKGEIAEGVGVISYKSGGLYVGQLKDDLPNGLGGMIFPDGVKYIGEWENDKANNKGTAEHKDGSRFIGGYKNGFRSRGFLITSDKKIFEEDWTSNKPSGNGTISYANGTEYVGDLLNGVPNGHGIKTTFDGDRYEGEWKDGKEWNLKVYDKNDKLVSRFIFGVEQE